jgi:hypothetical protein
VRICDLLLGPPPGQAQLVDHLDEAVGQLRVKLAAWWEADAELEALRTSTEWVWDLVLGGADGLPSVAVSMSAAAELLEGWIDAATANEVRWGTRSTWVATVSHVSELETKMEVLGSRRSTCLIEDEANALWTRVRAALDSLELYVPSSVACNSPITLLTTQGSSGGSSCR